MDAALFGTLVNCGLALVCCIGVIVFLFRQIG